MKSVWFRDCKTAEDKERRKRELVEASAALAVLETVLASMTKDARVADYNIPNWAYHQADTLGWNRALTTVQELIRTKDDR
jgi:hypothetical protein